jgi:hypothetical protein
MLSVRQGILQSRSPNSVSRCAHQSELCPLTGCKDIADPSAVVFETELVVIVKGSHREARGRHA